MVTAPESEMTVPSISIVPEQSMSIRSSGFDVVSCVRTSDVVEDSGKV